MLHLAHIVNPFVAEPSSDLFTAQPITFKSMVAAKNNAERVVQVDLLSAQFEEDRAMVPDEFVLTPNLTRSVTDLAHFEKKIKLPLLADVLERLYTSSSADFLIYSNVDIGLYPDFYLKVKAFIDEGHDAFIINRRRIENKFTTPEELHLIYQEEGKKHPGFDCFVFHRSLYPQFKLTGICIGVPFVEISFSQNLFALAKNFKLYDNEKLTFHLGMEIFKKRMPREYFWYNRRQFHAIEKELFSLMQIQKFPYYQGFWPLRFFTWALHPCIPTRLVLKLSFKKYFGA
ncbi:MAG: hypothetical protein IT236_10515 [Bacteroidia bacterium]|nr:hypothetical protein [Bacteroidia bacterium]